MTLQRVVQYLLRMRMHRQLREHQWREERLLRQSRKVQLHQVGREWKNRTEHWVQHLQVPKLKNLDS